MTERINIGAQGAPEAIFLRAVLQHARIKPGTLLADVELKVNGVVVPFKDTVISFGEGLENEAQRRAELMLSEEALKPLAEALRGARWRVRAAIAELPRKE